MNIAALVVAGAVAAVVVPASSTFEFVEKRNVRSATIYELNVDVVTCHTIVGCEKFGRRYELKPSELDRALSLVNERLAYDPAARSTCNVPRQAIVFETTQGKRSVDISLECNNVGGRTPTKATKKALSQFLRGFGYVEHVPFYAE